jgi:hypothetical protein
MVKSCTKATPNLCLALNLFAKNGWKCKLPILLSTKSPKPKPGQEIAYVSR